jgi:hypothetical protein
LLALLLAVWRRLPAAVAAAGSTCRRMATRTVPSRKGRLAGNQNPGLVPMATWSLVCMLGLDSAVAAVPDVPAWLAVSAACNLAP